MSNKALLAGLNKYPGCPLANCVNDVVDAKDAMLDLGLFRAEEMRMVCDERATTAALDERLQWLVADAQAGDRLLFWYSGHGTPFPIRDAAGKIVRSDCAICPIDFDWEPEHVITATRMAEIFANVPDGVLLQIVCDSCHSGDLFRGINPGLPRAYPMPADIRFRVETAKRCAVPSLTFQRALAQHQNLAYISGCRSDQTSSDGGPGEKNGACSYEVIHRLRIDGATTPLTRLVADVVADLRQAGFEQEPQLHGAPDHLARGFLQSQ